MRTPRSPCVLLRPGGRFRRVERHSRGGYTDMLPLFRGLVNCLSEEFPGETVSVFVVKNRPVDLRPKLLQDVPGAVEGKLRTPALVSFDPRTRARWVVGVANAGRRARPADFRNIERVSLAVCPSDE